jgi:hypothetical protein
MSKKQLGRIIHFANLPLKLLLPKSRENITEGPPFVCLKLNVHMLKQQEEETVDSSFPASVAARAFFKELCLQL